jgi:hypothetical protein
VASFTAIFVSVANLCLVKLEGTLSGVSKRNENPQQEHPQNHSRASQESPPPLQETTQTTGSSPPDALAQWRQSLAESKRLSAELERLVSVRTTLSSETTTLNVRIIETCDAGIAEPSRRAELASQLDPLVRDQSRLEHELAAINRGLDKVIGELQKNLLAGSYGWGGLAKFHQDDVLLRQTLQLLSGVQTPNQQMQEGAAELAKGSPAVVDAAKFSAVSSVSFAWSRPVTAETRESVLENITKVAGVHVRLAGELLPLCATLTALPLFEEPPAPPSEVHPEWNEALGAEVTVSDRMLEMSGKRREDLTPADLDILARAEAGNNSYLKEIKNPGKYAVGVVEEVRP